VEALFIEALVDVTIRPALTRENTLPALLATLHDVLGNTRSLALQAANAVRPPGCFEVGQARFHCGERRCDVYQGRSDSVSVSGHV
jgi:hypothetical protein